MIRRDFLLFGLAAVPSVPGMAQASSPDVPLTLVLATATPGGGFPVYGAAFSEAVNEVDAGLTVALRNTGGSAENVPLLRAGSVDLGLVQGEFAYEALAGQDRAKPGLGVVTAMYSAPGLFVVRADSPVRSIADLRGKRVALGASGSGLTLMGRAVLAGSGLDPDRDVEPVTLDRAGDGPAMVVDGRVAAFWGAGVGWPGFTVMANSPDGARFFGPSEEAVERILAASTTLRRMTMPAGSYKGQDAPIPTVGSWSLVLARPGLDEGAVYRLACALGRAEDAIARRLPQARETTGRNTAAAVPPEWLHPGVARHLRETGDLPAR